MIKVEIFTEPEPLSKILREFEAGVKRIEEFLEHEEVVIESWWEYLEFLDGQHGPGEGKFTPSSKEQCEKLEMNGCVACRLAVVAECEGEKKWD